MGQSAQQGHQWREEQADRAESHSQQGLKPPLLLPTQHHQPVERYVTPAEFDELREIGMGLGFLEVVSGPLVRSSYKAEQVLEKGRLPGTLAHLQESDVLGMA